MTATRECHIHPGLLLGSNVPCPECMEDFANRPDPATMTPEQRGAEMESLDDIMEVSFDTFHERIEALVGRPVWTHEIASSVYPMLIAEAIERPGDVDIPHILEKISIINPDLPVMAVVVEDQ